MNPLTQMKTKLKLNKGDCKMKIEIEEKDWVKVKYYAEDLDLDLEYFFPSDDLGDSKLKEILEEKFPKQWLNEKYEEAPLNGYFYRVGFLPAGKKQVIYRVKDFELLKLIEMYTRCLNNTIRKLKKE